MDGPVLASFHRQWPLLNLLVAYFANGEQMSRLSSVLGACCSIIGCGPVQRDEDSPGAGG